MPLEETQMPRSIAPEDSKPNPKWLMPDALWKEMELLLPAEKCKGKKTRGGRPCVDVRRVLDAIFYVLRTGCQWKALPPARAGARVNPMEQRPYFADAVFGDFDNDGWQDLVVLDRHESPNLETRALLFMNRGDGTFEPKPTTFSGLDGMGICGETADLNNDGLLDLIFAADPDNTGVAEMFASVPRSSPA